MWGVPVPILLAGWTMLVGILAWFGRSIFQAWGADAGRATEVLQTGWQQVSERDKQIDKLRQLLDRSRRRENAYATAFEMLLLGMKLPEAEQAEVISRARQILESALSGPQRAAG